MKKGAFSICSLFVLWMAGCSATGNRVPQLSGNLSPASVSAGSADFNLTVIGTNFSATCVVLWNGAQRPTQIVSSTQALAAITQADVAAAGTATIGILDTSTGRKSNTVTFIITAPQSTVQHQATLSWSASGSPVMGYNVYRGIQSGGPYGLVNTAIVTAQSFVDRTVTSGRTYFYVVTAVNNTGVESPFSNEIAAVIPTP